MRSVSPLLRRRRQCQSDMAPHQGTAQHTTMESRIAWAAWPMRRTRRLFFILLQTVAAEARVSLVGEVSYPSISSFFKGKVISEFNCSSVNEGLSIILTKLHVGESKAISSKLQKINQKSVSNYLGKKTKKNIQWFCGTASARVYKKSPYRRRIILIYIQLASLADVTALQIGRNFSLLYTKVLCCAVQYLEI